MEYKIYYMIIHKKINREKKVINVKISLIIINYFIITLFSIIKNILFLSKIFF